MYAVWAAIIATCLAGLAVSPATGDERIGSWGDQGDGTYVNPILNADYPDSDVEQVGDTYYMISSKNQMAPGMVILESKDMVNWTIIGHVWEKLTWSPEYNWDGMGGYGFGVYAGDLAYHDGSWYCYQIDARHGLYMSSAKDIRGPWSEPHKMLPASKVYDDPAVYWDEEEHQAYLICNTGTKLKSPQSKNPGNEDYIFKMSWDGREILDEGKLVYSSAGWAEAAKIYKFNGTWYLFLAEGIGSGDRKQIVLRSKTDSIYGPYEKRVVLESGNGITRSCSQGAMMQAPDGSWWYTHQLKQNAPSPFEGRPQCLEPVRWVDGWPIIGEDVDGDGIGEPVRRHKKPIEGHPVTAPATSDDFNSPKLGPQWEWNHNPRDTHWSLTDRDGWLRLRAGKPVRNGGFWDAYNTISQRIMGTTCGQAAAKFDLSGMKPGQMAGFVRFGGGYHLLGVRVNEDGARRLFFDANGKLIEGPEINGDDFWIRTRNKGDNAWFSYSTDGETFTDFGPVFILAFGKWLGERLGFFCWNKEKEAGHIDVDWFVYDYDGPKNPDSLKLLKQHKEFYQPPPTFKTLAPSACDFEKFPAWRYTMKKPSDGWEKPAFDDSDWQKGQAGFGKEGTPGAIVRTKWDGSHIWLRRTCEIEKIPAGEVMLKVHHDDDAVVYINGIKAADLDGYTTSYVTVPVKKAAVEALKRGANTIAIQCNQTGGGQYIDAGLVVKE